MTGMPFTRVTAIISRTSDGSRDDDGNLVRSDDIVTIAGGIFAPGGSTEQTDDQQRTVDTPTVLYPHGTDVHAVDAVVIDPVLDDQGVPVPDGNGNVQGDWYEVAGDAADWQHPNGWTPGIQIPLRRVTG